MTPRDMNRKLAYIATAPIEQLEGYLECLRLQSRDPFPGEMSALAKRGVK